MASLRIRPGLERITRLLQGVPLPWKAVHVAGTNGKGSTCAFISAMLHACNVRTGRFTSPHLLDRWDCITVNEKPVSESLFLEVEDMFKQRNIKESIEATSFELLTATAFEIFNRENVGVGVVECGMGGRLDATNIFDKPLATVITQLGMDHQAFLGNTERDIAFEKAGIMKPGVPCVVNSFSPEGFLRVLVQQGKKKKAPLHFIPLDNAGRRRRSVPSAGLATDYDVLFKDMGYVPINVQKSNMWCAYRALQIIAERLPLADVDYTKMIRVMAGTRLPGRFQYITLNKITGRLLPVVLDGAHNPDAWRAAKGWYKMPHTTTTSYRTVWVVACSNGRDPMSLFEDAIGKDDLVFVTEFGPVDGMPWVTPTPAAEFEPIKQGNPNWFNMGKNVKRALERACYEAGSGPIVISGSLYLAADVLRLVRGAGGYTSAENEPRIREGISKLGWRKRSPTSLNLNLSNDVVTKASRAADADTIDTDESKSKL